MSKQKHLSRLAAPKTWPIERKRSKWVAKPVPGTHSIMFSMPLQVCLTDILKLAKNKNEVKRILQQGFVLVDGKVRKEVRFPVGLFDTLQIQKYNKTYRMLINSKGQLQLVEIPASEAHIIITKIASKTTIKGGKQQIHLSNGWMFIADSDSYKIGDAIFFDTKTNKPSKHIKMEKGCVAYVAGGENAGSIVEIKNFEEEGVLRKKKFVLADSEDKKLKIPVKEIFIVGKGKPEIKLL
jgi:small subunit ribosomal protein S4e